ncbi:MAG: sodium:solute symporter family protein [Pseudomonadota bacterium]
MDTFTLTIAVSLVVFVAIGNYAGRNVKKIDDYFVAGRRTPTFFIFGTLVASVFSATVFLGEAGFTYDGQMGPYLLLPGITATGYVYGALLFGRYLRRSEAPTVADYFGQRFASLRVQRAAGVIIIVALAVYLLIVTQGAAILLSDLTDLSYRQGLVVAWVSYTIFTMYSGSEGVILTDTLMFLLFGVATIVFGIVVVGDLGGVATAIEGMARLESKPDIASWHGIVGPGTEWATPIDYLIWALVIDTAWSAVYAVSPWQASRHLMARNEHVVIRAAIYTCIAVIILQIFIYGLGGLINLRNDSIEPSETVMIWAAKNLVPEYLGALLVAGIIAAALSSASTFLSLIGFSASNDIVKRDAPLTLRSTRIIMFIVAALTLVASFCFPPNIFWLMLFVGTVFTSSWGPVALMSVWSRRITKDAAFWGMVAGFVFNVGPAALEYFGYIDMPHIFGPTVVGLLVGLAVIFTLSARGVVSEAEKDYRRRLHQTPLSDRNRGMAKTTIIAAIGLIVYGCVMPFLTINYYIIPYQRGAERLLPDGSINWSTGEAMFAFAPALLYIPLGIAAAIAIWRGYGASQGGADLKGVPEAASPTA